MTPGHIEDMYSILIVRCNLPPDLETQSLDVLTLYKLYVSVFCNLISVVKNSDNLRELYGGKRRDDR